MNLRTLAHNLGSQTLVRARDITLCDMSVGMVLCMDVADRCAWLATPGFQRHRTNISIPQVRGLRKAGLITTRGDQSATYTTFVISAKGQAEVRRIQHRGSQSLTNLSALIHARAKEEGPKQQAKPKMRRSTEPASAPHARRDSLRQAVERARKLGSLLYQGELTPMLRQ